MEEQDILILMATGLCTYGIYTGIKYDTSQLSQKQKLKFRALLWLDIFYVIGVGLYFYFGFFDALELYIKIAYTLSGVFIYQRQYSLLKR